MADDLQPIKITTDENFILAVLQCKHLDEPHADDMQDNILQAAEQNPQLSVILELSAVEFMPSLSLGALLSCLQVVKKNKSRFILASPQPVISQTLTICRLDKLFEICNTLDDAKAKLN